MRWTLQQDEHGNQTRLRLNYPSWSRLRSHWIATSPRNQHRAFRTKTHQHAQRKLARFVACATPVRPMACTGKTDGTAQTAVQRRLATAAAQQTFQEASVTPLGPGTKTTPKTQPARKKKTSQSLAKQLQTSQELTSRTTGQNHTNTVVPQG
jgi:hypothetical protein